MTDAVDGLALTPEQATAQLAELAAAYRSKQPADPHAALKTAYADPEFRSKLDGGSPAARAEFDRLLSERAAADPVGAAMSRDQPQIASSELRLMANFADFFRDIGLSEQVIQETLSDQPTTQAIHDEAVRWRERHMKDADWVKRLMQGDPDAVRELHLCSIVLTQPIKERAA